MRHPTSLDPLRATVDAIRLRRFRAARVSRRLHPCGALREGSAVVGYWAGHPADPNIPLVGQGGRIAVTVGCRDAAGRPVGLRFVTAKRGRALRREILARVSEAAPGGRGGGAFVDAVLMAMASVALAKRAETLHAEARRSRALGSCQYTTVDCPIQTVALARRLNTPARMLTPAHHWYVTSETGHMSGIATYPSDDTAVTGAALEAALRAADEARPFLATAGGRAMDLSVELDLLPWMTDRTWEALDGGGGTDSLERALRASPWMRDLVLAAHHASPECFAGPNPPTMGAIARAAATGGAIRPRAADTLQSCLSGAVDDFWPTRMRSCSERGGTWLRGHPRVAAPFPGAGGTAPATEATRVLAMAGAFPESHTPASPEAWRGFVEAIPVLGAVAGAFPAGMPALDFLDVRGDWTGYRTRLARAAFGGDAPATRRGWGNPDDRLTEAVSLAIRELSDLVRSLVDQVVVPACLLAGGERDADGIRAGSTDVEATATRVARAMAFGGRNLANALGTSRKWHSRLDRMLLDIDALSPALAGMDSWDAGLPDAVVGDVEVRCLRSTREMRDEGRRGANADGSTGLSHCVGTYVPRCMEGRSRILSLRVAGASPAMRLATAEVELPAGGPSANGPFRARQVQGMGNEGVPPRAATALKVYLAMLADGRLRTGSFGSMARGATSMAVVAAGYDFMHPGSFEAVLAIWRPHLAGHARNWDAKAIRDEVRALATAA